MGAAEVNANQRMQGETARVQQFGRLQQTVLSAEENALRLQQAMLAASERVVGIVN